MVFNLSHFFSGDCLSKQRGGSEKEADGYWQFYPLNMRFHTCHKFWQKNINLGIQQQLSIEPDNFQCKYFSYSSKSIVILWMALIKRDAQIIFTLSLVFGGRCGTSVVHNLPVHSN